MSRNKKNLIYQVKENFDSKLKIGVSRNDAKTAGIDSQYIYSWETYRNYTKHACYFVKWCRENITPAPRTLVDCRPHVEKWIQTNIDRGLSAYTIKLQMASMAKLYDCKSTDFDVQTPSRNRANIKRSRCTAARDSHFNEKRNADLVTFCRCTGLRRAEIEQIRGTDLCMADGEYWVNVCRGAKGGRHRTSPIIGTADEIAKIVSMFKSAGHEKLFSHVNSNADIHSYRAEYATRVYNDFKRPESVFKTERMIIFKNRLIASYSTKNGRTDYETFKQYYCTGLQTRHGTPKMLPGYRDVPSRYFCRNDLKTVMYDRLALLAASQALGHNRETIVAEHYIRA